MRLAKGLPAANLFPAANRPSLSRPASVGGGASGFLPLDTVSDGAGRRFLLTGGSALPPLDTVSDGAGASILPLDTVSDGAGGSRFLGNVPFRSMVFMLELFLFKAGL